jgi:hypothetical protein
MPPLMSSEHPANCEDVLLVSPSMRESRPLQGFAFSLSISANLREPKLPKTRGNMPHAA